MNKILVILIFLFLANVVSASSYKINDVVYLNACGGNPQVYKDLPLILKNLKEVPNKIIKLEKSKYERNFQTLATSKLNFNGKVFEAELSNFRDFKISNEKGNILVERKITGATSIYEILYNNEVIAWGVGWNKWYKQCPEENNYYPKVHYPTTDFSVLRLYAPYTDNNEVKFETKVLSPSFSNYTEAITDATKPIVIDTVSVWGGYGANTRHHLGVDFYILDNQGIKLIKSEEQLNNLGFNSNKIDKQIYLHWLGRYTNAERVQNFINNNYEDIVSSGVFYKNENKEKLLESKLNCLKENYLTYREITENCFPYNADEPYQNSHMFLNTYNESVVATDECIEGDCRNGKGTLLTSSGDKYIGEWRDNTFKGGTFISVKGKSYPIGCTEGNCNDGYGTYFWHNGDNYIGEWKEGKSHGQGKLVYGNGHIYIGEWSNNKKHGQGKHTKGPCYYYEGEWKEGNHHGQGIEFKCGEGVYVGEFKNNVYSGYGKFFLSCCCGDNSETTYEGHQYCNHYDGEFKDGKFHGRGKFTIMGTETIEGEWFEGVLKKPTYFINEEFNEFLIKGIGTCSNEEPQKEIFIQYTNWEDNTLEEPEGYVYYVNNIDESCLEKSLVGSYKKINYNLQYSDENYYEDVFVEKYNKDIFFENGSIFIKDNKLWYFYIPRLADSDGVRTKIIDKNQDMIFINIGVGNTHTRNFIFNTKKNKTVYLPNGYEVLFEQNYIFIKGQKDYFNKMMGAFWFNSKIDYSGETIELISDGDTCKDIESFYENIQKAMKKQGLITFCVSTSG